MNMLKKFMRKDNVDLENEDELDYGDYIMPDDVGMDIPEEEVKDDTSALDSPARKNPEIRSASAADLVSLKLLQPKSHTEAIKIADKLKEGCIVLLDISNLSKDHAHRLIDFLAGVAYVLGGEMIKTNKNTIVVSPAGVDISGFAPEEDNGEEEETVDEGEEVEYEEVQSEQEG